MGKGQQLFSLLLLIGGGLLFLSGIFLLTGVLSPTQPEIFPHQEGVFSLIGGIISLLIGGFMAGYKH